MSYKDFVPEDFGAFCKKYNKDMDTFDEIFKYQKYSYLLVVQGKRHECIEYLKKLLTTGIKGIQAVHYELVYLKKMCCVKNNNDTFDHIYECVFKY